MKILITAHYFYPHMGGIENVVLNQATRLVNKGHKVTIISSKVSNEKKTETLNHIKIIRIKAINLIEKKTGIPYPIFSPTLLRVLKAEVLNNDIVHVHGHVYLSSLLAVYFAKKYKKPVILTQHNTFIYYKNPLFRYLQTFADHSIGKYVIKNSIKIIAVSRKTKEYVESIDSKAKEIVVSYNGIDFNKFRPGKTVSNRYLTCLTVRRITFKNGIDTVLQVANLLRNYKIKFLIGGKGPDLEKVKNYIKENRLNNVNILGFVPDNKLPKLYSDSDIFILPSKTGEGFPLVVLEAFSSGIPVIATKSGGQIEVISNDKNGYLVNVDDPKAISEKIKYLNKNKKLLNQMKNNCEKIAREKFSWEENVKTLNNLYSETLK